MKVLFPIAIQGVLSVKPYFFSDLFSCITCNSRYVNKILN